jgi:hypothetical protein
MGLKYAHCYKHAIKKLEIDEILNIARHRLINNGNNNKRQPTIDVDCSLVVRSRGTVNCATNNSEYLVSFARTLNKAEFSVMLVFDGDTDTTQNLQRSNDDQNVNDPESNSSRKNRNF